MINLIRNELSKIFHKKVIYIVLLICLAFVILTNILYSQNNQTYSHNDDSYIEMLKEEIAIMTDIDGVNLDWYVFNKTEIDVHELKKEYGFESWQAAIISDKLYDIINNINYLEASKSSDKNSLNKYKEEYEKVVSRFDNNDWRVFVNEEIKEGEKNLENLEKELKNAKGNLQINEIKRNIFIQELDLKINNLRLDNDIAYGSNNLNDSLNSYFDNTISLYDYDHQKEELTYNDKVNYNNMLEDNAKYEYMFENKVSFDENNTLRDIYINFFLEYSLLIIVIVVIISGIIVSEEFNKGTIKLLLIRPYKRSTILLSKFITCLIMIFLATLMILIMQTVVGLIIFGPDSLSIPALVYNFKTNTILEYNIFAYVGLIFLTKLPMFILLATLAWLIGTLFGSSAASIAITFVGFVGSEIINSLALVHDVEIMKYFVTLNWDLEQTMFGRLPDFQYISFNFSIIVCFVYFLIMFILAMLVFKKKNIKNI